MFFWTHINNEKAIPTLQKNDVNKNHTTNMYTLRSERAFPHPSLRGSMVVEAAIVVPIVFFVWIACIALTSVVKIHTIVQNELTNTAIQLSMMSATDGGIVKEAGVIGAWTRMQSLDDLETGGVEKVYGFDFLESNVTGEDDWLLLKVRYRIRLFEGLIPIPEIKLTNQVYIRAWTGSSVEENIDRVATNSDQVYMTEQGQVYHEDRMCSHIRLKIYMVDESAAKQLSPCEKCSQDGETTGSTYYVTEAGNHYHSRLGCSGLKRTVEQTDLSAALALGCGPCSRCGGDGE